MSRTLPRIRAAVYNEPWMIEPSKLDVICDIIESALVTEDAADRPAMRFKPKPAEVVGSLSIIPIQGVISRRMNMFSNISGGTSIEQLDAQLDEALTKHDTESILFLIDSPGGTVAGTPEFASRVREASSEKTTIALADGTMASAAYYIGSQADFIYATEASTVGSIGVIARIIDDSRAMANVGYDQTVIRSSELKAAGVGPMTPTQVANLQERVDQLAEMFRSAVKTARPDINFDAGIDYGQTWIGQQAVDMHLVDGVTTLEKIIAAYA